MGSYAEYPPPPDLRPWVRLLWSYQDDTPSRTVQRIPPDGCPEIVVHLSTPYEEGREDGSFIPQPRTIFAGQMTRPIALRAAGPVSCVALRFEPHGAAGWFAADMETATDLRLDVSARLAISGASIDACRALLEASVRIAVLGQRKPDAEVCIEVARLAAGDGIVRSPAAQRRMQRLFLKQVGVPPRTLQSVFRFRKIFDHVSGATPSWIDAALAAGYFDQPQMARDFRRFLGCTATAWAREQVEIGRAMAS